MFQKPIILLLLGGTLVALAAAPPTSHYCAPVAYRDQQVAFGYQAVVRTAPGCKKPALVRKESYSGSVMATMTVPVGRARRVWLLTHHLAFSLDGRHWQRLGVR